MLSQRKRIVVGMIYFVLLSGIFYIFIENPFTTVFSLDNDISIIYFTGALFLVLGKYLIEPYFSKPTDAIINSISIILALSAISNRKEFYFFNYIYSLALIVFALAFFCIIFNNSKIKILEKLSIISYHLSVTIGQSKVLFSVVYLSAVYTYFWNSNLSDNIVVFSLLLLFWVIITFFDFVSIVWEKVEYIFSKYNILNKELSVGTAIGCENPLLYKVECSTEKFKNFSISEGNLVIVETENNYGNLGLIIKIEHLLNKKWLSIYLLQNESGKFFSFDVRNLKLVDDKSILNSKNKTFLFDIDKMDTKIKEQILKNPLYKNRDNFIGNISVDSDIYTVNVSILTNNKDRLNSIIDGAIVTCDINTESVRYQILNGLTKKEHLENHDSYGYTIAIARKLGIYNYSKKELLPARWMPKIYTPVFVSKEEDLEDEKLKEIAQNSIGRLPKTDLEIPIKNINDIVTHNTAILGILGIGKSCLTYELIQKIVKESIKIICIDITNEYYKELANYITADNIVYDTEHAFDSINNRANYLYSEQINGHNVFDPHRSGNILDYAKEVNKDLMQFLFESDDFPEDGLFSNSKNIRVYNPDYHRVTKGEKMGFNVITSELSQAEKTRIITEQLFIILMKMGISEDKKAKVLVVFEEAHSLIPEWNSVSNEGDKTAVNGTAKVILQGRKYGLGCLVVTQRTANVSKSILNQCNTIFALRVFDDTGKGFLENYIGNDYTSTLPSLEERHAIAIGKGLKLKQPVIIELNHKKYLTNDGT